ncbi:MAG: ATPase domain-containing protein [Anaerolineae bacterium]|nr:ATPase domain-containing protein [Anaerolineae bacterium]
MSAARCAPSPIERVSTGVSRLDAILHGGIPRYSAVFVAGLPGTGKTVLAEQALFANARQGRTGLYLSTISEPPIKVLRFLQGFTFFDPALFGTTVHYGDLGTALHQGGPPALLEALDDIVREIRPSLVVIDSFEALRDAMRDRLEFRQFTSDLAVRLSVWEVTSLLVGGYSAEDVREGAEFAIADGIIYLYGTEEAEMQRRYLRIMKMRGTGYFAGEHFFDITSRGIAVYPRMVPQVVGEYAFPTERISSAIEGLDEMLGGGLYRSTSTLISGGTGAGKTTVALSFLVAAARQGRPGLYVTFEESPQQLARNVESFGWDLEDAMRRRLIEVLHVSPSELNVDRHAFVIKEHADRLGAQMVAIDSITAFETAVADPARYQNYLWAISDYLKRRGVTVLMTADVTDPFAPLVISARGVSFLADSIIFLRYVEVEDEVRRAIGVLKMRGSTHDMHIRELVIEPGRVAIGPTLGQISTLGGTARAAAPAVVAQPEPEAMR